MQRPLILVLLLTIIGSGLYIVQEVQAVCAAPLSYRIGILDERFGLSKDEARIAIVDAESIWEEATGRNLFNYDAEADFVVNFIFDERQQFAIEEQDFRQRLDASESVNDAIGDTYEQLLDRYETLEGEYEVKVSSYEARLAEYNETVKSYNEAGGAPEDAFAELQKERDMLNSELATVNSMGQRLNELVDEINSVSEAGNQLIANYNENVSEYNDTFGEAREFTQGDYQGDKINIYKFINDIELRLVLAHELGHALSLDHVLNEESILYHLMGAQSERLELSEEDLLEFERVCGQTTRSFLERLMIRFGLRQ